MLSVLFCFSLILKSTKSAYCHGSPPPNAPPNLQPIIDGISTLQFLKKVPNGELYISGSLDQQTYVTHVWGSAYEMGYAQGSLLKNEIIEFINQTWEYIISEIPGSKLMPWYINMTLQDALQLEIDATKPFTPVYWDEEMQGLSDATGIPVLNIKRIHMLPSLTRGACSMFGANGKSTINSLNGDLIQLRALDWDTDGPFKDFTSITVYHPNNTFGNAFANLAFTGFIGSITGISSKDVSISEIGVSFPDDTFGRETRFGYPFPYVLRDILQFDESADDATKRLQNTHRTCYLILGAGGSKDMKFSGYEYSETVLNVFEWNNLEPYNQTWHPRIEDIVYWGMDWLCPGYSEVLAEQLQKYYGNINAINTIQQIVPITSTGDLHIAIYDYHERNLYFSFHSKSDDNTQYKNAYQRSFLRFNMDKLFISPNHV